MQIKADKAQVWSDEDIQWWRSSAKRWRRYQYVGAILTGFYFGFAAVIGLLAPTTLPNLIYSTFLFVIGVYSALSIRGCIKYEKKSAGRADRMAEGRPFHEVYSDAA